MYCVINEIEKILKRVLILINHTHMRPHAHVCDTLCFHMLPCGSTIFSRAMLAAMSAWDKNIIFYSFQFKINQIKFIKDFKKFQKNP